jgi:hypothetical protein
MPRVGFRSLLAIMSNTRTYRLFRPESLLAGELAWQGRPPLALGLPAAFTSFSAAAVVAAAVALITLGGYTRPKYQARPSGPVPSLKKEYRHKPYR